MIDSELKLTTDEVVKKLTILFLSSNYRGRESNYTKQTSPSQNRKQIQTTQGIDYENFIPETNYYQ